MSSYNFESWPTRKKKCAGDGNWVGADGSHVRLPFEYRTGKRYSADEEAVDAAKQYADDGNRDDPEMNFADPLHRIGDGFFADRIATARVFHKLATEEEAGEAGQKIQVGFEILWGDDVHRRQEEDDDVDADSVTRNPGWIHAYDRSWSFGDRPLPQLPGLCDGCHVYLLPAKGWPTSASDAELTADRKSVV